MQESSRNESAEMPAATQCLSSSESGVKPIYERDVCTGQAGGSQGAFCARWDYDWTTAVQGGRRHL